ncbi:hypothetical protein [Tindallia californiensis]|uniref:Uncharacterized protein n=1 Tax=Tindallia californiensis TaxID=159292 RepID=A0A1H3NW10_9FIRM|nr:hypothetical protein [Tindallia californiensis]SDY93072.1 hypothetical protein SAMN05192546_105323 [Tindallia californiensis]
MELNELRKTSMEFRRLSSNALRAKYDEGNLHLIRLRHYIEGCEYIQGIIEVEIRGTEIDYKSEFIISDGGRNHFNYPVDRRTHIKAILDYLYELTEQDRDIRGEASKYRCSSNQWNDIVRNFVEKLIKPLVDLIIDRISMDIMTKEQKNNTGTNINQYIDKNYGTANIASGNINLSNEHIINEVERINELVSSLKVSVEESGCEDASAEEFLDDLDTITENVNASEPKVVKIKKALRGIGSFIKNLPTAIKTSRLIITNSEELIEVTRKFMENFR